MALVSLHGVSTRCKASQIWHHFYGLLQQQVQQRGLQAGSNRAGGGLARTTIRPIAGQAPLRPQLRLLDCYFPSYQQRLQHPRPINIAHSQSHPRSTPLVHPVRAGHQWDTRRRDGPWQDGAIFLLSHAIPCVQIDRDIKVAVLYQIQERSSTLALFEIEHGSRTRLHSNCSILVL